MSRPPRIQAPNILFHVINRGNGRNKIFFANRDYLEYCDLIKFYKEKFAIRLYHYVLMPNHVHFLIEPLEENALSAFMQGLTITHTKRFHVRNATVGHIWQGRFKSIPIETDAYFLQCGRYIELNPVRASMSDHPSLYQWSSYHYYAEGKLDPLLDIYPFYEELGSTAAQRQKRYTSFIEDEIPNIKSKTSMRFSEHQVYGSESFIDRLKNDFNFELLRPKVGRPRNNEA